MPVEIVMCDSPEDMSKDTEFIPVGFESSLLTQCRGEAFAEFMYNNASAQFMDAFLERWYSLNQDV